MKSTVLATSLIAATAGTASAATFFNDLGTFLAATTTTTVETFEDPRQVAASVTLEDFTVSETDGTNRISVGTPASFGFGIVSGSGVVSYDDNESSLLVFDDFSSPFTAFGLWLTTEFAATVTVGGSVSSSFNLDAETPTFFGVSDTAALSSVSFDVSGFPGVEVDDVYTGNASVVPLPAAGVLMIGALGGLAALGRRKAA